MQDESFLADRQVEPGPPDAEGRPTFHSLESGHRVMRHEEENFLFRLSAMAEHLEAWLSKDTGAFMFVSVTATLLKMGPAASTLSIHETFTSRPTQTPAHPP